MMRHWKTIAKVAVAVLTALLGALGSAAATGVFRNLCAGSAGLAYFRPLHALRLVEMTKGNIKKTRYAKFDTPRFFICYDRD